MAKNKFTGFIKRTALLTLMGLTAGGASGSAVYFTMNLVDPKQEQQGDTYDLPSLDDNTVEETTLSKVLNSVINAKEITNGNINLGLKAKNIDTVNLKLKDLDVDLSQLNTTVVNVSTDVNVLYGGLDQSVNLRVENDEACYIKYHNKGFVFNIPQNLSDLMNILRTVGILVPNAGESTSSLDLSSILSQVQDIAGSITASEPSEMDGNLIFDISIPDITIKSVKISGLNLRLTADKDSYALKAVATTSEKGIVVSTLKEGSEDEFEEMLNVTLDGSLTIKSVSSYKVLGENDLATYGYNEVTDANTSLLSTVSSIVGGTSDVKIDVALTSETTTPAVDDGDENTVEEDTVENSEFNISGLMQAKITDGDFAKGTYSLSLDHLSSKDDNNNQEVLNNLSVYHSGTNTYLTFNDLLKAKVTNTTISDIFSLITEGSGKKAIEVISSQMETTLSSLDINAIKEGDLTSIQNFLEKKDDDGNYTTYFDYDQTTKSFVLGIDGSYLGLTDGVITIRVKCNTSALNNGIDYIKVSGLTFSSVDENTGKSKSTNVAVTLTPEAFSGFATIDDSEYSDFKGTVPLFDEICNIIGNKQFLANYSLTYNDKINDGTNNNYNSISATGKIGADLSKVSTPKLLDGTSEGTYYLSMNATTNKGAYNHNIDITYQNQNLYFGFDSIVKEASKTYDEENNRTDSLHDVTVFKNYIAHAQLGEIKDILDTNSGTSTSIAFDDVADILDFLGSSDAFKADLEELKKGNLQSLSSFISITAEDEDVYSNNEVVGTQNVIKVVLDIPYLFKDSSLLGKNIGKITLTLNSDYLEEGKLQFNDIELSTVISADQDFSFKLSFEDYVDPSLEDISSYVQIEDAGKFSKAFYNLTNNLKKYGIKIDAAYKDNLVTDEENKQDFKTKVSLNGSAYWDLSDEDAPVVAGKLDITHPYVSIGSGFAMEDTTATQSIKFNYQNKVVDSENNIVDGEFTADYNNNMHILMHKSTVTDIVDIASNMSETNVLNNLLDTGSAVASSMPIKDVISLKAPSILLDYPYINKVDFNDAENKIELDIDKRLFNIDSEGDLVKIIIRYDEGSDTVEPTLTSLTVDLSKNDGTKVAYATISLVEFDSTALPSVTEYNQDTKNTFVDLDGFANLIGMAMDTTEFNYYHIGGYLNVDLTMFNGESQTPINLEAFCFDLNLNVDLYVYDGELYTYLSVALGDKALADNGFYVTEYAFKNDMVYIDNTRTDAALDGNNQETSVISSTAYKVSKTEFKNNILYYLVSLGLDMDDRPAGKTIMGNIYDALGKKDKVTTTSDVEEAVTEPEEPEEEEEDNALASMTEGLSVNLSSDFSSIFTAGAIYDESKKQFKFLLNLSNLLSITYGDDNADLVSFGQTYLKLYHQTKQIDEDNTFNPFYALQLGTDVSVLDGLVKLSLRGQLVSNANNGELLYTTNEDDILSTSGKMARFYNLTNYIDHNVAGEYQITSFDLKHKKFYDFTKFELIDFCNDYTISDNGNKLTASIDINDANFASYISSNVLIYKA